MQESEVLEHIGFNDAFLSRENVAFSVVECPAGTILFKPGDTCNAFLILIDGSVRVELTGRQGRDVTLYRMREKESCVLTTSVLLNNEKYYAYGLAETDIRAVAIPTQEFYRALKLSTEFTQFVLTEYAHKVSAIFGLVDRITAHDVAGNLADYLISHKDADLRLTITQTELARELGTAREVVGRKLIELEKKGVISRERSVIQILSLEILENMQA